MIRTTQHGEGPPGSFAVHTGSVGYWIDDDEGRDALRLNPVRRKRLRSLAFSKATPIYSVPREDFALLLERLDAAGLERLPRHPTPLPPDGEAYYLLQLGQEPARVWLAPDADDLSARVRAGEISLAAAQAIAAAWGRVKLEVYNFGQYGLAATPADPTKR